MEGESTLYQAPNSELEGSLEPFKFTPVSKWLRFANLILDQIGYQVLSMIVGVVAALVFGERFITALESIPDFLFGAVICLVYYIFFEGLAGRTPGKFITGTKVVNELGKKASFLQIVGRSCSRLIPFEIFSFLGDSGRGWHDSLSNTYVVKCR